MSLTDRPYAAGHFAFELDGAKVAAYIKSVEGGFTKANLVDEPIGPDPLHVKHLSTREIEPIQVEMGLSGSRNVLLWIQDSWNRNFTRRNGQVQHGDFNKWGQFDHSFTNALIMETAFPTLDGSTPEVGYLKVKFLPEAVEPKQVRSPRIVSPPPDTQKMWLNSAFSLKIDGLDLSKQAKIEGFTIKQGVKTMHVGRQMLPEIEPTKIEFPDLTTHISLQYAKPVLEWYNETVRKGGKDPSLEKTGVIEYLTPDRATTIFSIKLENVGIKNFTINRSEGLQSAIKRAKVELYVGKMTLVPGPGMDG
jgi:hypothetical protein